MMISTPQPSRADSSRERRDQRDVNVVERRPRRPSASVSRFVQDAAAVRLAAN